MSYNKFGHTALNCACTLVFTAAITVSASLPVLAAWDEKYYNPKPGDDDVILPMPCEGFMAFRKVYIPYAVGPLADHGIKLGQDNDEWGYVEHSRPAFISGSFTDAADKESRYYLLAKYEMTELQYQSLMDESCPTASNKLRLPVVSQSWLEAMQAANKYNLWLREHAAKQMPNEDGSMGFLRLPTEVEWEFAARGGKEMGSSEFRDSRYPMAEGLNAYEWFAGSQSANGKLQLAGLLKPNPLGLHDMLGNADEMMFEPFRLNKLDRLHGQAGGYVVRGSNFLTPQASLHTAARKEQSYYSSADQTRTKTTGMRLALVSSTLTSRERIADIEKSWLALGKSDTRGSKQGVAEQLGDLTSSIEDKALKAKLKTLEGQLRASNQQEKEARDQVIRASLRLGAFLCTKMLDDGDYADLLQRTYTSLCEGPEQLSNNCDANKIKLTEHEDRVHKLSKFYANHIVDSTDLYGNKAISEQYPVEHKHLIDSPKLKELAPYLSTHWQNQQQYFKKAESSPAVISEWLASCKNVRK